MILLAEQCRLKIEDSFLKAEAAYGRPFKRCPVVFSHKLTRTAGKAITKRIGGDPVRIKLSMPILLMNKQEFIDEVPAHEAAHIIANQLVCGDAAHGPIWKEVMGILSRQPTLTHDLKIDMSNRVMAKCECKDHHISKRRATNMRNGSNYICALCKTRLVLC